MWWVPSKFAPCPKCGIRTYQAILSTYNMCGQCAFSPQTSCPVCRGTSYLDSIPIYGECGVCVANRNYNTTTFGTSSNFGLKLEKTQATGPITAWRGYYLEYTQSYKVKVKEQEFYAQEGERIVDKINYVVDTIKSWALRGGANHIWADKYLRATCTQTRDVIRCLDGTYDPSSHRCGIYATSEEHKELLSTEKFEVLAHCSLHGVVMECEAGYRASECTILQLFVDTSSKNVELYDKERIINDLREKYQVPVFDLRAGS